MCKILPQNILMFHSMNKCNNIPVHTTSVYCIREQIFCKCVYSENKKKNHTQEERKKEEEEEQIEAGREIERQKHKTSFVNQNIIRKALMFYVREQQLLLFFQFALIFN